MPYRLNLDTDDFLQRYWQRTPVVIRQALPGFADPLSPDELAGLALEENVASRVILRKDDQWQAQPGPPEDYAALGEQDWQLLVQAVNHHHGPAQALCDAFRFLPDWRFDDLMASFAVPGGGVGPHIDNYDVFILQGEGRRRWQVGQRGEHRPRPGSEGLALVADFDPIIDVELAPGDLLYIPPGYPHCGQTLTPSLSYSLGYRAPSQQELLSALADHLLDTGDGQRRFTSQQEPAEPARVSLAHQQGMAQLLTTLFDQGEAWQQALGLTLSQNRFELDLWPSDEPLTPTELSQCHQQGHSLVRLGGLKVLQLEGLAPEQLFLDGQRWVLPQGLGATATLLARQRRLSAEQWAPLVAACPEALCHWLNQGYWQLET
ncbi:cupin domain-containing protein [Ferrimonas balearica]|uniref:cupin domain-containing protein n=1 Tax=Ferrimonas balearica TaxID=44012 RepID=UPI001C99AE8D|nr:cupin domain-containing protein [Ferrimonas balearica]MBY5991698.1 cupin domain-containing protein [Ferrimonas balearica]